MITQNELNAMRLRWTEEPMQFLENDAPRLLSDMETYLNLMPQMKSKVEAMDRQCNRYEEALRFYASFSKITCERSSGKLIGSPVDLDAVIVVQDNGRVAKKIVGE